jgi:histidinol-phosphate aminotransferase
MPLPKPTSLIRPCAPLASYVPGEQPKIRGLIKLNTNENPYPPSPKVLAAIKAAADGRLRLYPNPTADGLRAKLAKFHGCAPEQLIVGNGSDELLALATRAFVEPGQMVQFFTPSYSLYPVLADIHGARRNAVPLAADFALPSVSELRKQGAWDFRAPLTFITTPNAPSGRGYPHGGIEGALPRAKGRGRSGRSLRRFCAGKRVFARAGISARAGGADFLQRPIRSAFCAWVTWPATPVDRRFAENSRQLQRQRPGPGAAEATLGICRIIARNFKRLIATRERLSALRALGFDVLPSQTNFIFVASAEISGRGLAAEIARAPGVGALVRRAGNQRFSAHHHRDRRGSGCSVAGGAENSFPLISRRLCIRKVFVRGSFGRLGGDHRRPRSCRRREAFAGRRARKSAALFRRNPAGSRCSGSPPGRRANAAGWARRANWPR